MNFIEAIKSGFNNYINFKGRASRSEYWFWTLFCVLASIFTLLLDTFIVGDMDSAPINAIFSLAVLLPSISVGIRRLHDVNHSGWWLLLCLTGIGALLIIYWAIKTGSKEANKFGNNPLTTL